ncbi:similar to Saccharomyces cerevisiae YFR049W YMR31 Mitochondrial ribosomal protein of the small subunit, has similarity to human mitochondrial ribosomal protein MRP-S36 [Maudiozyma saulgeensis]|uniref:Similar to Saccharomyces cerevisiae YFR049W YMR31 Mitochondrial ribosomal protein of the small subunit, has similarity to human mitochondrial ribosomal protein MRP-S36 n=1 Tax=Maudiozyma saulgeensis TaxID=1789683 RepID=A0A1X7RAS1_9SACH|nr:similar to Saccharomyces cerevisiae YFR049W YMR31 Mitochondrial ribosomal protein of the small subunit, has similarity to human mitochondrial ribosomal protein MRP-S36 [Kazachstania saulgeensis]
MLPTQVRLAHAYKPLIKFVGNKAALVDILKSHNYEQTKPHPCTINGIAPGSKDCLSVDDILSKQLPFKVVPYVNKNPVTSSSDNKYNFTPRGLKEGELNSIFELPKKYQYKPIDDLEIEAINNGGAI